MIRIMHVVQSLEVGGLENGIVNLVNNLNPAKFEFNICCIRREGLLKNRIKGHVKVINLAEKDGFNPFLIFKVAKLCKNLKIDIMHTHGWAGGLFLGVLGAKIAGVPIILNGEHGVFSIENKKRLYLQKFLFSLTDQIIPVSFGLENDLIRLFALNPNRITTIINGVDEKRFIPDYAAGKAKRKELGLNDNDFIVGAVGRLVPIKDYKTVLNAVEEVIKECRNVKFIFIGSGPLRGVLENQAKELGVNEHVIFLGERNDVPELFNVIDLYVMSSINEGLSNTVLEAMSSGKAVIATNVGGNPEVIKDKENGLLFTPGDTVGLISKIVFLFHEFRYQEIGRMARKSVEERFSLSRMVTEYERVYTFYFEKIVKK